MLIILKVGKSTDGHSRHTALSELCFASDFALHLNCCLEVLDRRARLPCAPALLPAVTALCSADPGVLWQAWLPGSAALCFVTWTMPQPQLSSKYSCSGPPCETHLLLCKSGKQTFCGWEVESHPKSWTWGFSTVALHLFLLPGFLFACLSPNAACGDYVSLIWSDPGIAAQVNTNFLHFYLE